MENLNLLYNKTLYDKLGVDNDKIVLNNDKTNVLKTTEFHENDFAKLPVDGATTYCLKTVYPGLLVGTGYSHGISDDSDFKIGFSFDYVTGQPYIPGSSVKGVLRNAFEQPEIIEEMIAKTNAHSDDAVMIIEKMPEIIENIFEKDDCFFDAVIKCGDSGGYILDEDYITPHISAIKNPKPIKMLKVRPNVVFEFRFLLKPTEITLENGKVLKLSADDKKTIFKNILIELGIGAKTNVGYGILVEATKSDIKYPKKQTDNVSGNNGFSGNRSGKKPNSIKCPYCGRINYRCYRDSEDETKTWKRGICFNCGKSLGIK